MAKKRGASPLGNTLGSEQAQALADQAQLSLLKEQVFSNAKKSELPLVDYLNAAFDLNIASAPMIWRLASGKSATFAEVQLNYEQVKNNTFVRFETNGRDQGLLSESALNDLNSMEAQQFYPAVGCELNGKIEVLDGSRRRAWFLLQEGKIRHFRMLLTQSSLSPSDAKALAKQLQTAKEHNLREVGLQCVAMKKANSSMTQKELAESMGLSQSGISKAMKAAAIDERLIRLFPNVNELTHPDYTLLAKVMKCFSVQEFMENFIDKIREKVVIIQAEYSENEQKNAIIFVIKKHLKIAEEKQHNIAHQITPLAEFSTPGMFARKKVNGRNFSYEFGRLSRSIQNELDEAIQRILEKRTSKTDRNLD